MTTLSLLPSRSKRRRFYYWSLLRPTNHCCLILLLFISLAIAFLLLQRPLLSQQLTANVVRLTSNNTHRQQQTNDELSVLSYETLQQCVDDYTSRGAWNGKTWRVDHHSATCRFQDDADDELAAAVFRNVKVGFMGDSTTRSDLRAWEETFRCNRTNLDESQVFQKKNEQGSYVCRSNEQSMNLTKCGIPPVIDVTDCPRGVSFRYFYKIYPWTALDQWQLQQQLELFRDLDVLVISLGRWFVYYEPRESFDIAGQLDTFLVELKKVFSGVILYQSEYPKHLINSADVRYPVPCMPHAVCGDCGTEQLVCVQTDHTPRPQSDIVMRSVLERHRILHLDRWNVSKSLPVEHFQHWYCRNGTYNRWSCSHHLGFAAMQHMRLIAAVIKSLFGSKPDMEQ